MSYQVLARKWRPKSFQEMVGQDHILTIMANSLSQNRIHHAYLFCGTRGVGKTTLARIFAKCLNCHSGPTAEPCNQCEACHSIDEGRFVDLIEIDAASRTKVEDTRELLDNVQYAPTAGKYKVYLIDEVHMLSGHSFNALLKTLEEPPEHVKFLLATTDPQKLPVTVLSRCIKLQLNMLSPEQIQAHLTKILTEEGIGFEENALQSIAIAARGSVRDSLSLLDQAIVYCGKSVQTDAVHKMLGTVSTTLLWGLLESVQKNDLVSAMQCIAQLSNQGADLIKACDQLLQMLYFVALFQSTPKCVPKNQVDYSQIEAMASKLSPEQTQLHYQTLLIAKRDLPLAPTLTLGFEMAILRMSQFVPSSIQGTSSAPQNNVKSTPPARVTEVKSAESANPAVNLPTDEKQITPKNWPQVVHKLGVSGATFIIAKNATVANLTNNTVELRISEQHAALYNEKHKALLEKAISTLAGKAYTLTVTKGQGTTETPQVLENRVQAEKSAKANQSLKEDDNLTTLLETFDAKIDSTSVTSIED